MKKLKYLNGLFLLIYVLLINTCVIYAETETKTTYELYYYPKTDEGNVLTASDFGSAGDTYLSAQNVGGVYKVEQQGPQLYSDGKYHYTTFVYYEWKGYSESFSLKDAKQIRNPVDTSQYGSASAIIHYSNGETEKITTANFGWWDIPEGHEDQTAYIEAVTRTNYARTSQKGFPSVSDTLTNLKGLGYVTPVKVMYELPQTPYFSENLASSLTQ